MPDPGLSDVHVDAALTDFSTAYFQDPGTYAWRRIAPVIPSPKQSNKFFTYTKADLLRTDAQVVAPNTEAPVRTYKLSNDNFYCDVYKVAYDLSEQVAANSDAPLDPEEDAVRLLVQDLNIKLEQQAAATFFTTSVWGTDNTSINWADAASTPIEDIATAINTIRQNTGYKPNTLFLGAASWYTALQFHPDIIARLPDNAPRIATPSFVGQLLGLDVVIGESIRNTAGEGATASYSDNFGAHALVAYVAPNPGPRTPTAAATFNWTGLTGAPDGIRTLRIPMPWKDAMPRIQVEAAVDFKVVGSDLGYFFSAVTT